MGAYTAYVFGLMEPDERAGVFLHGFPTNQAIAIDVQASRSPSFPGAFVPEVELVLHNTGQHVDGTAFHRVRVHNVSTSTGAPPRPVVSLAVISETLS